MRTPLVQVTFKKNNALIDLSDEQALREIIEFHHFDSHNIVIKTQNNQILLEQEPIDEPDEEEQAGGTVLDVTDAIASARKQAKIELAAELFSLMIYANDGYLKSGPNLGNENLLRLLKIASPLPLEVQEKLCLTAFKNTSPFIPVKEKEEAFKRMHSLKF